MGEWEPDGVETSSALGTEGKAHSIGQGGVKKSKGEFRYFLHVFMRHTRFLLHAQNVTERERACEVVTLVLWSGENGGWRGYKQSPHSDGLNCCVTSWCIFSVFYKVGSLPEGSPLSHLYWVLDGLARKLISLRWTAGFKQLCSEGILPSSSCFSPASGDG